MRVLLDANVLLRSLEQGHPQHAISHSALDALRRHNHELVLVPQVLYELWTVMTRPVPNRGLGMSTDEAWQELAEIKGLFRLLRDERAIYEYWEQLISTFDVKGKPAHDARLAAAMQRHGIAHLLTFNTVDFARYPFVTTWEPSEVASGAVTL